MLRTALLQRAPQEPVRCADERDVAGLPLAAAHLTIAQPPRLLPIPMQGLGPCPAMPIYQDDPKHFPAQRVAAQRFPRLRVVSLAPAQHKPHGMRHGRKPPLFTEGPIAPAAHPHRFFRCPRHLRRPLLQFLLTPRIHSLTIELQVAHRGALLALAVVEDCRARARAITREVARNRTLHGSIDQLDTQPGLVLEGPFRTGVPLLNPAPLEGLVGPRRTHIMRDEIIVCDNMPRVSMIPAPAHVFDPRVVDGDAPTRAVAGWRHLLQPCQPAIMQGLHVPLDRCQPPVQARWIGREGTRAIDAADGVALGDHEPRQLCSKMAARRFGFTHIAEDRQRFLHDRRAVHNGWHKGSLQMALRALRVQREVCPPLYDLQLTLQNFS